MAGTCLLGHWRHHIIRARSAPYQQKGMQHAQRTAYRAASATMVPAEDIAETDQSVEKRRKYQ